MTGYIEIPARQRKFNYTFEDGVFSVYSTNSIPATKANETIYDLIQSDVDYLIGTESGSGNILVFFVDHIPFSDGKAIIWTSVTLQVYYYLELNEPNCIFGDIRFSFPELDYFINLNNGVEKEADLENRSFNIKTLPYDDTKQNFEFKIGKAQVKCELGIKRTLTQNPSSPLSLSGFLSCSFQNTSNIAFLLHIYAIIKRLFCFLCYRKNVNISDISLYSTNEKYGNVKSGDLHICFDRYGENECDETIEKTIEFRYLKDKISSLMQLIADDELYFEHIPANNEDSHHITPARFVLITAAFEWNFKKYYTIPVSSYRTDVKNDVLSKILEIAKEKGYNSKKKSELKLYQKIIQNVDCSLSESINHAFKDCDDILNPFIDRVYKINGLLTDSYSNISQRLQTQRNNYAHGNIDKEMDDNIVLDTIFIEWLNYCMVFKVLGYSNIQTFNIINHIFNRRFVNRNEETDNKIL